MGVEELQAVPIQLDGAPRVAIEQVVEIGRHLRFGQLIEVMIKIITQAP